MISRSKSPVRSKYKRSTSFSFSKLMLFIVLLILLISVVRMTVLIKDKLDLVNERKNVAAIELAEIDSLATELEKQTNKLYSEEGVKMILRERYGLVAENEGFILLTDEYPEEVTTTPDQSWWQIW